MVWTLNQSSKILVKWIQIIDLFPREKGKHEKIFETTSSPRLLVNSFQFYMETSPSLHFDPKPERSLTQPAPLTPRKNKPSKNPSDPIFGTNRLPSEVSQQCLDQDDHLQPSLSTVAHPAILENLKVEVSWRNSHPEDVAKTWQQKGGFLNVWLRWKLP